MLTIDIPETNARKSAEDELAQFILDKLKDSKDVCIEYYHSGCEQGSWKDGKWHGDKTLHKADCKIIWSVARAFRNQGYIVNDTMVGYNVSRLIIIK